MGEGGSKNFVVLKLQPVNLKRFLAVTNRYQHGQVYLTTKGSWILESSPNHHVYKLFASSKIKQEVIKYKC